LKVKQFLNIRLIAEYIAEKALNKIALLNHMYPMECDFCQDWEGIEKLWKHSFYTWLRVASEEYPVL
jgi:hypothetical protein